MAIKIHHGPNGSYKTSGAIQDDLVPAIKKGRYIITNIRGLTRERVFQVFPDTPSSLEVLNLELEDPDDLERMRTWFTWAPRGAFIIFDETQLIFLKSWREGDLKRFDFDGGPKAAKEADRPMNWLDAWTRHRHFNWDVILTTPNIAYIRDDIRNTAEKAYLHSNMAVIGISGRYKETQHAAIENRPPARDTIVELKKIKKETFKLYDSTATGIVTDTIAGKSIFKQPKVLLFMSIPALAIGSVIYDGGPSIFMDQPVRAPAAVSAPAGVQAAPVAAQGRAAAPAAVPGGVLDSGQGDADFPIDHPFAGRYIAVEAGLVSPTKRRYQLSITNDQGQVLRLSDRQLFEAGYQVYGISDCVVKLTYGRWSYTAVCEGTSRRAAERLVSERSGETGGAIFSAAEPIVAASAGPASEAQYLPKPLPKL